MKKKSTKKVNAICKDCPRWEAYGKECWYWWEGKKECSHEGESLDVI